MVHDDDALDGIDQLDLGSLESDTDTDLIDEICDELEEQRAEAKPTGTKPDFSQAPLPAPEQPVNKATMCCLRGPCCNLWQLTLRGEFQASEYHSSRIRTCMATPLEFDLNNQNIWQCDSWWPAPLSWVPVSLRTLLRPWMVRSWERWLVKRGYDLSWRKLPLDIYESDRPEQRGKGSDATPATFLTDEQREALGVVPSNGRKDDDAWKTNSDL